MKKDSIIWLIAGAAAAWFFLRPKTTTPGPVDPGLPIAQGQPSKIAGDGVAPMPRRTSGCNRVL